jgi:DNA repair protein RadA/Sms
MARVRTIHRCSDCGAGFPKWSGRCGSCGAWNTLVEEVERPVSPTPARLLGGGEAPQPVTQIISDAWRPVPTGLDEFDRVLGGGLVPGSVSLLGGEPGIGKSTLLLQLLGAVAVAAGPSGSSGRRALLISGEESTQQVRLRAQRLDAESPNLWIGAETDVTLVQDHLRSVKPDVAVIDSIQTMSHPDLESAPGTVSQVRDCATALTRLAKELGIAIVLVGHVTKEGGLAGPRTLEHLVDTVLSFEGDRNHQLRLLRAVKHRFGATGELGVFEMQGNGLQAVADPSAMLLGDRQLGAPGSILTPVMEGNRPLLVEVQGLVAQASLAVPRRVANGLDLNRLAVLLAVTERRASLPFGMNDVFASVVGGVRITETAADLAFCLALASSVTDQPLPPGMAAVGEVGLAGEVRQVAQLAARAAEVKRLGLTSLVMPANAPPLDVPGLQILRVESVSHAFAELGLRGRPRNRTRRRAEAISATDSANWDEADEHHMHTDGLPVDYDPPGRMAPYQDIRDHLDPRFDDEA